MHTAVGISFTATEFHVWEHTPTSAYSQFDFCQKPNGQIPSAWASELHHFAAGRTSRGEINKIIIIIKNNTKTPFF